jgi:hypothetical protein
VFDPRADLSPGRRVRIDGKPGSVRGLLELEEEGDRWVEALVHLDEGLSVWLSVEWMPTPAATIWFPVRPSEVDGGPGEKQVRLGGASFAFYENGTASYRAAGETGTEPTGRVDYVDYVADDSRRVSFERYGEAGAGRRSTMLTGTCPQCGAAWQPTSTGHCTSCGVNPTVDVGAWGTWEVSIGIPASQVTAG